MKMVPGVAASELEVLVELTGGVGGGPVGGQELVELAGVLDKAAETSLGGTVVVQVLAELLEGAARLGSRVSEESEDEQGLAVASGT